MGLSRGARRDRQGAREPWEPRRRRRPCGPKAPVPGGLPEGTRPPCSSPPRRGVLLWPRQT